MILFCEYFILEQYRNDFVDWSLIHRDNWQDAQLLENIGQPGVYVEIWSVRSDEEAGNVEKERRERRSWRELDNWIKGGNEGLRIWVFRPVFVNEGHS
jgi:hypothetical protein